MDVRAYLQWKIEIHQAARERARKIAEKCVCGFMIAVMAGLWIAGWMIR